MIWVLPVVEGSVGGGEVAAAGPVL
jgi:hypothetical protein